jgi:hypothetical protein
MPLASKIDLPERYRVARHIASGGMASVWEAEDLLLGRVVAVKVLGAQYAADPDARARFQREARTAAQVSDQSHVVTIFDIGEHGSDAFIVMEYFAGGTVADRLRSTRDAGARVPRETALLWLRQAAAGLDVAHAAGIVHRDVKPANLLLDSSGRLAVGDFGIARLADDTQMTKTGQVLGTAAYISPEQALGRPATPSSDIYALALVAYELLTGTRPFAGGPATAQAMQHAAHEPTPASQAAPELPASLDRVFGRGLAKDPAQRPHTAGALVADVERALLSDMPIEPTRPFVAVAPAAAAAAAAADVSAPAAAPDAAALAPVAPRAAAPAPAPAPRRAAVPPAGSPPARPPVAQRPDAAGPAVPGPGPARVRRRPREQRRGISPLIPIGVVAVIVGALVALAIGAGRKQDSPRASSSTPKAAKSTAQAAAAQPPAPPPPPAAATGAGGATGGTGGTQASTSKDPKALGDRGYQLSQAGNDAAALPLLRDAVAGYRAAGRTEEIDYAYALFNYAVALRRSGQAGAAVPLLQERLKFDNQRATVQKELDQALKESGQTTEKKPGKPGKGAKGNLDEG